MSDEPTYIDWLTTIEPEEVCEIASKYGNRYAEITEEQIEELRAGDVLFVAALFALISNVDISININKEDKHDDG